VVIAEVLAHEAFEMSFVENKDMIEQISPAVADPALSATPFCQGLRKPVRFGSMPKLLTVE
jgi:hypothetical protein